MIRVLLALVLCFWPLHAMAQLVSLEVLCNSLPTYQPSDDVEFVPGQDDVVPADINPLNAALPEIVHIPITVELAERFPELDISDDLELEPHVGVISIQQDGRVFYNDQDISEQAYTACKTPVPEKSAEESEALNGQAPQDTVNSQSEVNEVKEGIKAEALDKPEAE